VTVTSSMLSATLCLLKDNTKRLQTDKNSAVVWKLAIHAVFVSAVNERHITQQNYRK